METILTINVSNSFSTAKRVVQDIETQENHCNNFWSSYHWNEWMMEIPTLKTRKIRKRFHTYMYSRTGWYRIMGLMKIDR